MEKIKNYINGKLVPPLRNKYLENYSPINGLPYSLVPNSDEKDVQSAVLSAKKSFNKWGSSTKEYRY